MNMGDSSNALEYIRNLAEQDQAKKPSFSDLMEYMDAKARREGIPLGGQFELTPLCNFDCKMCYTHLTKEQIGDRSLLSTEQWKQIIHDAWNAGMMSANLTGGECLTYPGFKELYLYLRELGCEIIVLSNGSLLDEQWIDFFRKHKPRMIQITLYGGDRETYLRVTGKDEFERVVSHIRAAADAKLPVALTITPNKYMAEGAFQTIKLAKELGIYYNINGFLTNPKEETGRSGQNHDLPIEKYAEILAYRNRLEGIETLIISPEKLPPPGGPHHEWKGCGLDCKAGQSCFTVEWDGKLYACGSIRDIWAEPLRTGFVNAWNHVRNEALRYPAVPECIECPYRTVCTNCAAIKTQYAEKGKQPILLCKQTQFLVQQGVKRMPDCY